MNYYKFTPLLKTLIWGTESWQISGVPGNETLTAEGCSLNTLVREQKGRLVGEANYQRFGDEFPLLIKFIDAHQDLSIQVHPTDEIAHRQGKPRGKTEMWYVMDSQPTAKLYNGLKMQITPEEYKKMVDNDTICDALAQYSVKEGDCFFIPAGRIHAIGAGCYLAEIQQTSDVPYRIYDYRRRDKDGNLRQLHTQEASESIDYTVLSDYRQQYTPSKDESQLLVECPYFNTADRAHDHRLLRPRFLRHPHRPEGRRHPHRRRRGGHLPRWREPPAARNYKGGTRARHHQVPRDLRAVVKNRLRPLP